ncbi:MAG: gliding motility-associated C-terminal domain-containing protein [Bacteroidales bacterium]|nr:gliding motility-associated C-terminal domain-containing protein [Bacteroidales bacterium]
MEASRYSYTIGVYDHCGLRETRSSAAVIVLPSTDSKGAFFPNIFTPSRVDNNQFCPSYRFITRDNYRLDIYNRMGMRVFESNDPSQCWDGTHNGQPMAQGVYVYQVRCRYIDGTLDEWRGTLLLLD